MPPRSRSTSTPAAPESAALVAAPVATPPALPADVMASLLREQRESIGETQRLPSIKVMPQGIGMFEFTDDSSTPRTFRGIILHTHARNVLWDKPFGTPSDPDNPEDAMPACASPDGVEGMPRPRFTHLALRSQQGTGPAVEATGNEIIACNGCPYNAWSSAHLINKQGRGKACANQRSVYVLVEGRDAPMELVLPPTSITALDEYLTTLTNHGRPVQTVLTEFAQDTQTRGTLRWSTVKFAQADALDDALIRGVLAKRLHYMNAMSPQLRGVVENAVARTSPGATNSASASSASSDFEAALPMEQADDLAF